MNNQSGKKKVLLIGWDGADWEHINPLMDEGLMPTLESLVSEGTMANLATLQPVLSPMLWNSVATGKFADKHGIHGFVEKDPNGGARPYSSVSRKTKALWNIFSQNGIRSNVINWWASHPAEPINGCIVSNLFQGVRTDPESGWQITPGTIHPKEKEAHYAKFKFFPHEIGEEHILPFIPKAAQIDQKNDQRLTTFAKVFSEMMTTHSIGTAVMELEPSDFTAIYYTGIDHFCHAFMAYHPPKLPAISEKDFEIYKDVIKSAYRFHDMMLARLLDLVDEDTTVVLCSDHGFESGSFRPEGTPREPTGPAIWHRQYGVLVMKGPGIKKDERIHGASLVDIGPTLLHLYGLPVGEDMDGRVLMEAFEDPVPIQTIPTWDEVPGYHGLHPDGEPVTAAQSEEMLQQFIALGYVEDFGEDKEKQSLSAEIEGQYNLSRCLIWQNRIQEAQPILESLVTRFPWEDRFIVQLADCYYRGGHLKQARKFIQAAYDLETTPNQQAIMIYAKASLDLGERGEGLKHLSLALHRAPRLPQFHTHLGDAFAKYRQWNEAEQAYLQALNLHQDFALAYQGLAYVYLRTRKIPEAIDVSLRAVGLLHRLPKAHLILGIALTRANEFDKAILAFKNAEKFAPRLIHAHRWLAKIYELKGLSEEAETYQDKAQRQAQANTKLRTEKQIRRDKEFPIAELPNEKARTATLLKERPTPNNSVKESGKTFILVSGLPRSGTSLMMQMLAAGEVKILSDDKRLADEDNPKGYHEWEAIKKIEQQPELLDKISEDKKALKVISMLLSKMPPQHHYKVIFMMRPLSEVAASQTKMITHLGTAGTQIEKEKLIQELARHRAESLNWLKQGKNIDHILVSYPSLVSNPDEEIIKVSEFLGNNLLPQPEKMKDAIDTSLYRNKEGK